MTIGLAEATPFRLGRMEVRPMLLEAAWPGGRAAIQPRAMQVLIMLAEAGGAVVSRDRLIAACWDGRAVGDDAINRIIHLLRDVAEESGGGGFRIQTIAKVGYRLLPGASETHDRAPEPRLAVLAFDNLTDDPDLAYFADGISEEILHTVSKTTALNVVGRSSSFSLRGADKSAPRVAALLGATHLLDGSVRRSGDRLRVSAQLEACAGQTRLWSDRFDRPVAEVFALQDEIAAAVAAALDVAFAPSPPQGPIDPAAYDLFLRARDTGAGRAGPSADMLEQAVALAPDFPQAWALLAYARGVALRWSYGAGSFAEQRDGVVAAAGESLARDPASGLAHLALTTIEPLCGRFEAHLALATKALAAAPNDPMVLSHAGGIYDVTGQTRLAFGYVARAYELDPRLICYYYDYLLEALGRSVEAAGAFDRDLARWPDVLLLHTTALRSAYSSGDWVRYDRLLSRLPASMAANPIVALIRGHAEPLRDWSPARASAALEALRREVKETGTTSFTWAGLLSTKGLTDEIYEILDAASFDHLSTPEGCLPPGEFSTNVLFSPIFAAMRRDRRFVRLCARLGLCEFWQATGTRPDFADEVAPLYDLGEEMARLPNRGSLP